MKGNQQLRNTVKRLLLSNAPSAVFLLGGIWIMAASQRMRGNLFRSIGTNPATFPWLLGLTIVVLTALAIVADSAKIIRSVRAVAAERSTGLARDEGSDEHGGSTPTDRNRWVRPVGILASTALFTLLMPILGYVVASISWAIVLLLFFRAPSRFRVAVVIAGLVVATFLLFEIFLPVRLPRGFLLQGVQIFGMLV